ncbi:amidophosphoribosyltransferase [Primorskyibacter marinus]|uniref:amidophosphoribosyltransferase n=1 Tax=Primorskyibacter marinus TaxID=1977320 RepID=UPI001E560A44|nr:amidophosphoribosyltransferase [Primorskyibacter marinus]
MAQPQTTSTPQFVFDKATERSNSNLRKLILLGTFGPASDPKALLRLSNGRVARVAIGDKIGGAKVLAIDDGKLALAQNGKTNWLATP